MQCIKVCLKKLWPNWDPNLRCLKLINMTIIKRYMELYLPGINKYCFTTGVLFLCVTAVLISAHHCYAFADSSRLKMPITYA